MIANDQFLMPLQDILDIKTHALPPSCCTVKERSGSNLTFLRHTCIYSGNTDDVQLLNSLLLSLTHALFWFSVLSDWTRVMRTAGHPTLDAFSVVSEISTH
ncbi:hypothetical protein CRM22_010088 [Opisthorchis felineus]|uniref:Uncharacterized protein n=1 Tax=Opisthorchis felineus TaxID=147828 RepID=A0A4S2L291_OPIFE|nr:hypothetical protein CRM22_010088 [Opisthorchis felineus]